MTDIPIQQDNGNGNGDGIALRDEMAIKRTYLALERTLLSYLRTAMSLVLAGLTIVTLISQTWFVIVGFAIIPIGIALGIFGVVRAITVSKRITGDSNRLRYRESDCRESDNHDAPRR